MVDKHVRGLLLHGIDPAQQPLLIRVAAHTGQNGDLRVYGDLVTEDLHALGTVVQLAAERADRLITHEQHRALRPPEVILQMVPDAAGVAHAARGEDDLRRFVVVERHGVLFRDGGVQVVKIQRIDAAADERAGLVVEKARVRLQKDARGLVGERAVHIHGEVRVAVHHAGVLDLADEIQQLLRAADGERRDDHVAAAVERALDAVRERGQIVHARAVAAVAVGRLDEHVVRARDGLRVADDGLVGVADVAGKDDLLFRAALGEPCLDARAAEQVADIREADDDVFPDLNALAVAAWAQQTQHALHVLERIQRLGRRLAGAGGLAPLPLGLGHLDVRRVAQHDAAQVAGRLRGVDRAAEALLIQQRQVAGVVHVRVRDEHKLDLRRRDGDGNVLKQVPPLLHAAVDQAVVPADLEQGAAAGHLVVGADKCQLHGLAPFRFSFPDFNTNARGAQPRREKFTNSAIPRRGSVPGRGKSVIHFRAAAGPRGTAP